MRALVIISRLRLFWLVALCVAYGGGANAEDSNLDKILSDVQESLEMPQENPPTPLAQSRAPATPEQTTLLDSDEDKTVPESFKRFIDSMWQNQTSNNPDAWASDFAPTVNYGYAASGSVGRSFIRNDRAKLIKRYPERSYQMIEVSNLKGFDDKISGVWKFRYSFRGAKLASGRAVVHFTVQWQGDSWQFVSYSEEVERD